MSHFQESCHSQNKKLYTPPHLKMARSALMKLGVFTFGQVLDFQNSINGDLSLRVIVSFTLIGLRMAEVNETSP